MTASTAAMTAALPSDQDARDRIRTSIDETLFVEAGAGSGKTRALVDRHGAKGWYYLTGAWPGEKRPDPDE